jgi:hypothetical protein
MPHPDLKVFTAPDGTHLYQAPNGSVFDSDADGTAYLTENQVDIILSEFMAQVDANPLAFLADKKGKIPENERALLAMKTRLRNNAEKFATWYLDRAD